MSNFSDVVINVVGGGGLASIVVSTVGWIQKRNQRKAAVPRDTAETNNIVITQIVEQNKRLADEAREARERMTSLESKIDELEAREDARDNLLREHHVWDDTVEEMLRRQIPAIHWPTRPPLSPPQG